MNKDFSRPDLYSLLRPMMLFRLIAATAFLFIGFLLLESSYQFYILIGVLYFLTIVYLLIMQSHSASMLLLYIQIAIDILIISCLIAVAKSMAGIFLFLYLIPIVSVSLYFGVRRSTLIALGCGAIYSSIILFKHYAGFSDAAIEHSVLFSTIAMNLIIFYIVGFLSGYLGKLVSAKGIELRNLQNLHYLILDNMNSGLISTGKDGKVIYSNTAAEQVLGYRTGELKGKDISSLFIKGKGDRRHFDPSENRGRQGPGMRSETFILTKNLEEIPIGYNTSLIRNHNGETIGKIVVFTDLRNVKRLEERLRQADRLKAVGELAAGIAHEIRNPLAAISGSIEMLAELTDTDEANKRLFDVVQKESARLNLIIEGFLNYTRESAPKLQRVDAREMLGEIVMLMKNDPIVNRSIKILIDTLSDDVDILGEPMQLKQVFINLIKNAADAMPEGGKVIIEISRDMDTEMIDTTVTDTGCGIKEEDIPNIFTPFFTTKAKGVGIGLSVAEKIVRSHGGQISVESRKGEGTKFTVSLPAWSKEMEAPSLEAYGANSGS
jgi:two-component system, NtrC family, sensor histidine kinase PilS